MSDSELFAALADYSRRIHVRGWVANHDGNLSARLESGRIVCTPTAVSKADVTDANLVTVEATEPGATPPFRVIAGDLKPPSEVGLHLTAYRLRPDARAVLHAHPPTATGFAVAGVGLLERPVLPEAVVSLGASIPTVPFAAPGSAANEALEPFLHDHDAMLLAGHGVLTLGDSVEQAYLRMELVEHLARIALVAHSLGATPDIPGDLVPKLLEARRKAGLGPEARADTGQAPRARGGAATTEISRIVREEIERALRDS